MVEPLNAARLLDNLTTSILVIDADFQLIYINPAAQTLLATSGSRLTDLSIQELFCDPKESVADLRRALQTGQPYTKREASLRTPAMPLCDLPSVAFFTSFTALLAPFDEDDDFFESDDIPLLDDVDAFPEEDSTPPRRSKPSKAAMRFVEARRIIFRER